MIIKTRNPRRMELMVKLSRAEEELLRKQEIARIVTLSKDGYPHIAPMWFAYDGRYVYIGTDSDTKKVANILNNNKVAVLVDSQDWHNPEGVLIQGKAEILKKGDKDFDYSVNLVVERFPGEKKYEGPKQRILKITPVKVAYWKFKP